MYAHDKAVVNAENRSDLEKLSREQSGAIHARRALPEALPYSNQS